MFSLGFIGTVASMVVGGAVAAVTIVGLVTSTVDSQPDNAGSVSGTSQVQYGTR